MNKAVSTSLQSGDCRLINNGPHCAVGRILYANGAEGIIVYSNHHLRVTKRTTSSITKNDILTSRKKQQETNSSPRSSSKFIAHSATI